ncbi:MAG: Uncharacterized protein Athens101426_246 [Parcubacteria group bacterium Athens1014_26]|nr:MAG: Uncharacterized protein Athens101426_246 [Parcubacteria group bacterium Athens1014_26]
MEISKKLDIKIPKSTLSAWCKNIILPNWYKKKIKRLNEKNLIKAQQLALISNKLKYENILKKAELINQKIGKKLKSKDILKAFLSILYLGEGAKWKSHHGLMLGSSDPIIIKLYIQLLKLCYDIKPETLKCRVSYRADQNINDLQEYWSKITLIQLKNFYKTIPDPRTIGKPTKNKDYKGVCVITCGGTSFQLELEMIPKLILRGL